ncbi:MAG: hypothetical protein JST68_14280 [Bacteroidetes bacterium]|nr:hypothetical protein [Bacteroidota bacterium]
MDEKEIKELNGKKLQKEIDKLNLETKEIKRTKWKYWITTASPLAITNNQRTEYKKDTSEFNKQKREIQANITHLSSNYQILKDSSEILNRKVHFLDSIHNALLKNSNETVRQLIEDNQKKATVILILKRDTALKSYLVDQNKLLSDSLRLFLVRQPEALTTARIHAIVEFGSSIRLRLMDHPIRQAQDQIEFGQWIDEYVALHH